MELPNKNPVLGAAQGSRKLIALFPENFELLGIGDAADGVLEGHHTFVQGDAVAKNMEAAALGKGVCHGGFQAWIKGRGSAKQPAMAEAATVKGLPK